MKMKTGILLLVVGLLPAIVSAQDKPTAPPENVRSLISKWRADRNRMLLQLDAQVVKQEQRLKDIARSKIDRRVTEITVPSDPKYVMRFPTIQSKQKYTAATEAELQRLKTIIDRWANWHPDTVPYISDNGSLEVGAVGKFSSPVRLVQILEDDKALAEIYGTTVILSGVSLDGKTDDSRLMLQGLYEASGTEKYATVTGASRTVLVIKPFDFEKARPFIPKPD